MKSLLKFFWLFICFTLIPATAFAGCEDYGDGVFCVAPEITRVEPGNGASVAAGTPFQITIDAFDPGSSQLIVYIRLYRGGAFIGEQYFSPNPRNATAVFSVPALSAGSHQFEARVFDQGGRVGSSGTFTIQAQPALGPSTTSVSASPANPVAGQTVTITARVSGNSPTGSVTFDGGYSTTPLVGAEATITKIASSGSLTYQATYTGDSRHHPSTGSVTIVGVKAPTSTSITATPQTIVAGQSVTLGATVDGGYAPQGTVTFRNGNQVLGSAEVYSRRASLVVTPPSAGTHTYTAVYNGNDGGAIGNNDHAPSTSPTISVTVTKPASQTSLTINEPRTSAGQIVSFRSEIKGTNPTGTVEFRSGSTVLGKTTIALNIASLSAHLTNIGQHSVIAYYGGDDNNAPSSSPAVSLTIEPLASRIKVEANPASATAGTPVTIRASVSAVNLAGETVFPGGTVTFKNGSTVLGTRTLEDGSAVYVGSSADGSATFVGSFPTGTHTITASYDGGTTATPVTSTAVTITATAPPVIKTPTETTLTGSPFSAESGSAISFTAHVTGDNPTGTVTFKTPLQTFGTVPLSGGTAAFRTSSLDSGNYYVSAIYNGDEKNLVSTSNDVTIVVTPPKVASAISVTADPTSASIGQSVTLTAVVSGKNPSGTVAFKNGDTLIGTSVVANGVAKFSSDSLPAGVYTVTASYSGDSMNTPATSGVIVLTVSLSASRTTLSAAPGIVLPGQPVQLTARIDSGTATGTVTFRSGTAELGVSPLNAGTATLVVSSLPLGEHQIQATYNGNGKVSPSSSAQVRVSVAATLPVVETPHLNNPNAGTLPGTGSVSGGKATYSIPIALPPGVGNMVPTVSLEYGGSTNNSEVGVGWSLSAYTTIVRCGPILGGDGKVDAIRLTNKDRLCLNGEQLILSGPSRTGATGTASYDESYWSSKAEYRTKSDQFVRITRSGTGFSVETRDGRVSSYGGTRNSERTAMLGSMPVVHTWAVRSVNDRSSNIIDYEYLKSEETGEHLLGSIRWGSNLIAGQRAFAKVSFEYKPRPDTEIKFINGGRADLNQRLERIIATTDTQADGAGGVQAMEYVISYGTSPSSGRSMIKSVQGCSSDAGCLPETKFSWGEPDAAVARQYLSKGTWTGPILEDRVYDNDGSQPGHSQDELYLAGDFNLDGKTDLLTRYGGSGIKLYISMDSGFSVTTPFAALSADDAVADVGDFNGDGLTDVLISTASRDSYGFLQILDKNLSNPRICLGATSGSFTCQPLAVDTANSATRRVYDFDGDGRGDLYFENEIVAGSARVCLSSSTATNAVFTCQAVPAGNEMERPHPDPSVGRRFVSMPTTDLDGDGQLDLISAGVPIYDELHKLWNFPQASIWFKSYKATSSETMRMTGSGLFDFDVPAEYVLDTPPQYRTTVSGVAGDLNGDGYSDLLFVMGPTPIAQLEWRRCYSRGIASSLACEVVPNFPQATLKYIGDIDGDGSSKLLLRGTVQGSSMKTYQGCDLRVASSPNCVSWIAPAAAPETEDVSDLYQGERLFWMNVTGDSRQEMVHYRPGGQWEIFTPTSIAKQGEALDRLVEVTNGLGLVTKFDYTSAAELPVIYSATPTSANGASITRVYPMVPTQPPGALIKGIRVSNGQGGWNETRYQYGGAASDSHGRGYLGFARIDATNSDTGITTTTWYSQEFPYIGMVTAVRQSTTSGIILTDTMMELAQIRLTHVSGQETLFPYVKKQTVTKRDLDNTPINTTVTDWTYSDGWGNANVMKETITGSGKSYVTETTIKFQNSATSWLLGLPISTVVVKTADGASIKRSSSAAYDTKGLLSEQIQEPDDVALRVRTVFSRDTRYGNVSQILQEWVNPATSATETRVVSKVLAFDPKHRFATEMSNAESHVEKSEYDTRTGVRTIHVTANGITTNWRVDGFGRVLAELRPDATESRMYLKQCDAECPPGGTHVSITEWVAKEKHYKTPALVYLDSGGRKLRTASWGFNGTPIVQDYRYDPLGRLTDTYHPRFENATPVLASTQGYDILDRVTSLTIYDELGTARETTTTYSGLKSTVKTARAKQSQEFVRIRNAAGMLAEAIDPDRHSTQYRHDPTGNLLRVIDPKGNIVDVAYDRLGRRKSLKDPDLGEITYDVDPLGRTWRQQSPKDRAASRSTKVTFDRLDRMVKREEADLLSTWIFDIATNGVGQLAEAFTGPSTDYTYKRQHTYDHLGRPAVTTEHLDMKYVSEITYDEFGNQSSSIHQRGSGERKVYDYLYNELGHLKGISGPRGLLLEVKAVDAAGRIVESKTGNGLTVSKAFNSYSGRLESSSTGGIGRAAELIEEYRYNELGQVKERSQWWASNGYTEGFEYDNLDRIEQSWVVGRPVSETTKFRYDSIGNLISKSGVGTGDYIYPGSGINSARPHAVSSIPGVGNYQYDINGNLEFGPDDTKITWTNFDMPINVARNGNSSEFVYGPEHQRIKQRRSDGVRQYYAGAIEAELGSNRDIVRTYWPLGLGYEVENLLTGTKENFWVHKDNLGSVVGVSGANGQFNEKMAYDVWGKRRGLDGTPNPSVVGEGTDHRGFTGHEMLDNVGFVHMNARIYDPFIARFVSADSIIQDPEHSQSYNRYSYVWNNPANLTDPTGLEAVKKDPEKEKEEESKTGCTGAWKNQIFCAVIYSSEWESTTGNGAASANSRNAGPGNGREQKSTSANNGPSIGERVSDFFSQAMRSFGVFDYLVPSRESFESGAQQLMGGACEYNCHGHDAMVRSTADVMQGAAQGVAEAGNRYYPELAKNMAISAVPVEAIIAKQLEYVRQILLGARSMRGNFNIGNFTRAEMDMAGQAWVGRGARPMMKNDTQIGWTSADNLKTYRFPELKARGFAAGRTQGNLTEYIRLDNGKTQVIRNAHMDLL